VDYLGQFNRENRSSSWDLHAYASGVDVLRFYDFGNETANVGDKDFTRAKSNQFLVNPSLTLRLGRETTFTLGPAVKFTQTRESENELINIVKPYGAGDFGELALHGELQIDARDSASFTRRGVLLAARGTLFPAAWDVKKTFGEVNGDLSGHVSAGKALTLAVRVGGKKVFGDYPYMEAAAIGGGGLGVGALGEADHTVRGFRARRFIGDASAYADADVRLHVSHITLILPGDWGLMGFVDTGRVWLEGEHSDTWHTGTGGGLWISLLNYRSTLSAGVAHSKEENLFYLKGGFTF
jgi:outer membrane protein assembly factor BamA